MEALNKSKSTASKITPQVLIISSFAKTLAWLAHNLLKDTAYKHRYSLSIEFPLQFASLLDKNLQ